MNCKSCPSYNNGKGSKTACSLCDKFKDVLPKIKPGPPLSSIKQEILEDIGDSIPITTRDLLKVLDETQATMLLQSTILNMTHKEIAAYHLYDAAKTVQRNINKALQSIRELIIASP